MKFRVTAIDSTGAEKRATVEASNEDQALVRAKAHGLFPTKIEAIHDRATAAVVPIGVGDDDGPPAFSPAPAHSDQVPLHTPRVFEYKMVQVPPNIAVEERHHRGSEAAIYLENVVNSYAREGWEFFRVDSIGVKVLPGCLGIFAKPEFDNYYVVTFRRSAQ